MVVKALTLPHGVSVFANLDPYAERLWVLPDCIAAVLGLQVHSSRVGKQIAFFLKFIGVDRQLTVHRAIEFGL